jgi:hypothetical protein
MDQDNYEDDRRPELSDEPPSKKQRLNRPRLTPLINPNAVDEQQQQANEQQQAGRKRKRRSRKAKKSRRKSSRKSRRSRR